MRFVLLVFALSGALQPAVVGGDEAPAPVTLPAPTGPHGVGTRTWYWIDASRPDDLTEATGGHRGLMVQMWYPCSDSARGEKAAYMPFYGWHRNVRTHGIVDAVFAPDARPAPVVVICPGRGTPRHYYTVVAEDLASHGYAVVAIDSPHSGMVVYPDGHYIQPTRRYKPSAELMKGPYEKVDAFFEEAAALGAGDVAFALRELEHLNRTDGGLFECLDLDRIGVFGHSLGGRIAGAAAAADPRFKGYVAMESVPPRAVRRAGMDAAVAMLMSGGFPEFAEKNIEEVVPKRRNDVWLIRMKGLGHNSVTDEPLVDPDKFDYEIAPEAGLDLVRGLLRSFFDRYVRDERPALEWVAGDSRLIVRRFEGP